MESVLVNSERKPHVVIIPFPAQSHIKCMLKLAKILHQKGVQITFVNTEFNHKRFLKSGGPNRLDGAPGFKFETIPDGLPDNGVDTTQDINALCISILTDFWAPFLDLVAKLDESESPVTCIIVDGLMPFTKAAEKVRVPFMQFWTVAAIAFMGFNEGSNLLEKGVIPLPDKSCFTNGYLDTVIDWIPGMEGFRLKDFPGYIRTTDTNEVAFNYITECAKTTQKTSHIILHTFEELESTLIELLKVKFPNLYTVGPLQLLLNEATNDKKTKNIDIKNYSLWKEEPECIKWLQTKEPNSVVYVNFGSITVMSFQELVEFGWGLANSNHYFIWVIRADLVIGESAALPPEFEEVIKKRGLIASWCPQEEVLNHPAVGGFLTHCGWGSVIESLSAGVPMICWPFFGDQPTNCRQVCKEWEVGMEIGSNVKRDNVEKLVRDLMDGVEGKRFRNKAMEWKSKAEIATSSNGSSSLDVEKLARDINMFSRN